MIGREDLDKCPKCQDTAIQFHHSPGPEAITTTAKWCDCRTARLYLARLSLAEVDLIERFVASALLRAKTPIDRK